MEVQNIIGLMQKPTARDEALIARAFAFAAKAHAGQARASGEPYFIHPVSVAKNLCLKSILTIKKNMKKKWKMEKYVTQPYRSQKKTSPNDWNIYENQIYRILL